MTAGYRYDMKITYYFDAEEFNTKFASFQITDCPDGADEAMCTY